MPPARAWLTRRVFFCGFFLPCEHASVTKEACVSRHNKAGTCTRFWRVFWVKYYLGSYWSKRYVCRWERLLAQYWPYSCRNGSTQFRSSGPRNWCMPIVIRRTFYRPNQYLDCHLLTCQFKNFSSARSVTQPFRRYNTIMPKTWNLRFPDFQQLNLITWKTWSDIGNLWIVKNTRLTRKCMPRWKDVQISLWRFSCTHGCVYGISNIATFQLWCDFTFPGSVDSNIPSTRAYKYRGWGVNFSHVFRPFFDRSAIPI